MFPVEEQVELLKEAGVERAVLFPTLVHPEKAGNKEVFKREMNMLNRILSGEINPLDARISSMGELVSVIEKNSDKFIGFGSVPTGKAYDLTSDWIETHIVKNKLSGIGEIAFGAGEAYKAENIFKSASDYDGKYPVWVHTFNPLTVDDIRVIIGYAEKYSGVKTILGHGGGSYWLETIDYIKNKPDIYFDISASFSVMPLKYGIKEFPERILFSSDMPYGNPRLAREAVEYIVKDKLLREMVLGGNVLRLLN